MNRTLVAALLGAAAVGAVATACVPAASVPATQVPPVPSATGAAWVVVSAEHDGPRGSGTYSVTCVPSGRRHPWRQVQVSQAMGYAFATGDRCPSGPVLSSGTDDVTGQLVTADPDSPAGGRVILCKVGQVPLADLAAALRACEKRP